MVSERRCGRTTAAGKPCRNLVYYTQIACKIHSTEQDLELEKWMSKLVDGVHERAYASGKWAAQQEVENAARAAAQAAEDAASVIRLKDDDGAQIVQVGKYAYRWRGENPLEVGDSVLVPGNWLFKEPQWLTVSALGSDYTGVLSSILSCRRKTADANA